MLCGLGRTLADRRPAWLSVAVCRICLFGSILYISQNVWIDMGGDAGFAAWYASRAPAPYYPFGPLLLFGSRIPPETFWYGCEAVAKYAGWCAILGFLTRPAMVLSTVSSLFLVVFLASSTWFWSHPYNVVFLCALPFSLCNAGSAFSLDHLIGRFVPRYPLGRRTEPVFWGVLAGQAAAALFYFGAFYAKIFETWKHAGIWGPFYYVFSDNMRNMLGVTWRGVPEHAVPPWIRFAWSYPIVWELLILGHLIMQAVPILAIVSVDRPRVRLLEGITFLASIIALGVFMAAWNPLWISLCAFFVDWDHWAARIASLAGRLAALWPDRPPLPMRTSPVRVWLGGGLLFLFFGTYSVGVLGQRANTWKAYPFSNFSFYAALYLRPPYDRHMPYADYFVGQTALMLPPGTPRSSLPKQWIDFDSMPWRRLQRFLSGSDGPENAVRFRGGLIEFPALGNDFHGLGREGDLEKLKGGMLQDFRLLDLQPMELPAGTKVIVFRNTVGFPAYPEAMRKTVLHRGVRGILDIATGEFAGLTADADRSTGLLTVKGIRGEVGDYRGRRVFVRVGAIDHSHVQPLIAMPGSWVSPQKFQIDRDFILHGPGSGKLVNSIIRTNTIFGPVDFDGFVEWW